MSHTITVEPLTRRMRLETCHTLTPQCLAVVERMDGSLVKVCAVAFDITHAYSLARGYARTYGAQVMTRGLEGVRTIVGVSEAIAVHRDPDCQPERSARTA